MMEYILLLLIILVLFVVVLPSIRIIGPRQKGIVTRRGKYKYTAEPGGMYFVFPLVYRMKRVSIDEYEEYMSRYEQTTETKPVKTFKRL